MRRIGLAALLPALALSGCAHSPAPPPPEPPQTLFAMFQKYCLATEGQYAAVDKAATEDGFVNNKGKGVLADILGIESTTWQKNRDTISTGPIHNTTITVDGKKETAPWEPQGAKAETCWVSVQRESDDSQAALAKWAAVPVWHNPHATEFGDEISDRYNFRIENGKHIPDESPQHTGGTITAEAWTVTLFKRGKQYDMTIRHYMPKS